MRVELYEHNFEHVLKKSTEMGMTPTQYVNALIENCELQARKPVVKMVIEVERIEPVAKPVKIKKPGFVQNW